MKMTTTSWTPTGARPIDIAPTVEFQAVRVPVASNAVDGVSAAHLGKGATTGGMAWGPPV
jgi:hypothetical protein